MSIRASLSAVRSCRRRFMRKRPDPAWVRPLAALVGHVVFRNLVWPRRPGPDDFGLIAIVAGPRRRRGATREGDHPAWQGVTPDLVRQSNRKPGIPASQAKPLPRSAGVRSRIFVVRFSL